MNSQRTPNTLSHLEESRAVICDVSNCPPPGKNFRPYLKERIPFVLELMGYLVSGMI